MSQIKLFESKQIRSLGTKRKKNGIFQCRTLLKCSLIVLIQSSI